MENKTRKASDILLDLESKLDIALNIIRAQDLNIKILSNKLTALQETVDKMNNIPAVPKIVVEAVDSVLPPSLQMLPQQNTNKTIPISSELNLPVEHSPQGFRRTSRPETFAGDDSYLPQNSKYPPQIPKMPATVSGPKPPPGRELEAEIIVPPTQKQKEVPSAPQPVSNIAVNAVPVEQRVVNSYGRSLFLADVELTHLTTMESQKTRTNGSGKWMASLPLGPYKVVIRKYEPSTKSTLESTQEIRVDGTESPLQLQTVIIK